MNEVINLQIAGQVFYIDRNAYEKLEHYFDTLRKSVGDTDDSDEIIGDIEVRVAELLIGRKRKKKEHITIDDILFVIETIGPINDEVDDSESNETVHTEKASKHLFRDLSKSMIAGICAGYASRFNLPVGLVRLIFIGFIFAGGLSVLIYLIAWITVPPLIQLPGKSDEAKGLIPWYHILFFFPFFLLGKIIKFFQRLYNGETKQLTIILQVILTTILLLFNILIASSLVLFNEVRWMNSIYQFAYTFAFTSTLFVLDIYLLSKIFRHLNYFQRMNSYLSKNVKLLLIITTGLLISLILYFSINLAEQDTFVNEIEIPLKSKKLFIQYDRVDDSFFRPYLRFEAQTDTADSLLRIELFYIAFGQDSFDAQENAEQIDYKYTFKDSVLSLPDYFNLIQGAHYRQQRLVVKVTVPNKTIIDTEGEPFPATPYFYDNRQNFRNFNYSMENSIFYWSRYLDHQYIAYDGEFYSMRPNHQNRLNRNEINDFTRQTMRILFESNRGYYQLQNWIRGDRPRIENFGVPIEIADLILEIMTAYTRHSFFENDETIHISYVTDLLEQCDQLENKDLNMQRYIQFLSEIVNRKQEIAALIQ